MPGWGHLLRNALLRSGTLPTGTLLTSDASACGAAAAVKLGPIALALQQAPAPRALWRARRVPARCARGAGRCTAAPDTWQRNRSQSEYISPFLQKHLRKYTTSLQANYGVRWNGPAGDAGRVLVHDRQHLQTSKTPLIGESAPRPSCALARPAPFAPGQALCKLVLVTYSSFRCGIFAANSGTSAGTLQLELMRLKSAGS